MEDKAYPTRVVVLHPDHGLLLRNDDDDPMWSHDVAEDLYTVAMTFVDDREAELHLRGITHLFYRDDLREELAAGTIKYVTVDADVERNGRLCASIESCGRAGLEDWAGASASDLGSTIA